MPITLEEILTVSRGFEADFINTNGEIILDQKTNTYAIVMDCESLDEVNMRMVFALARPIHKSFSTVKSKKFLNALNRYFGTALSKEDMEIIYQKLCYHRKQKEFTEFIKQGFPMENLKEGEGL